ncbi:MAG TPA: hypothetical protein VKR52_10025 [Terracidiphilus sp.]|nr:hypothetical protein [Terracidiphilus sp.]
MPIASTRIENEPLPPFDPVESDSIDWVRFAASGSLLAGGLLYLLGRRRAGLATAVTGATIALLDQQDLIRRFWRELPGYMDQVQQLLDDMENLVDDIGDRRRRLHQVLHKAESPVASPVEP